MKHELGGKLARQATRAPRANIAEEQLALKLARLMSMIQSATKANPNKQTKTLDQARQRPQLVVFRKWKYSSTVWCGEKFSPHHTVRGFRRAREQRRHQKHRCPSMMHLLSSEALPWPGTRLVSLAFHFSDELFLGTLRSLLFAFTFASLFALACCALDGKNTRAPRANIGEEQLAREQASLMALGFFWTHWGLRDGLRVI